MEIDAAHAPDPPAGAEREDQERAHIIEQDVQAAVAPAQGSMEEERARQASSSSNAIIQQPAAVEPVVPATPPRGSKRGAVELEPMQETPTRGQKRSAGNTEEEKEAKSPKASPEAAANTSPGSGGSPAGGSGGSPSTLFQDAWQEQEQIISFEEPENFFSTESDEEIEEIEEDSKPAAI